MSEHAASFPEIVEIVVEIPRGSRNKYEFDEEAGVFRLNRVLSSAVFYNFDYGFIEGTRADDGDLVFEVPASLFTTLTAEPIDKSLTQVTGDDINRLDLAAAAVKVTLVKVDNKWYRADDKGTPGDEVQADAVRDITSAVGALSAVRWAAYDAKAPARFGLDKPALRLTMKTDKAATTLLLSAKEIPAGVASIIDQKPARYAMTEGGQRIAILAGKSVETLLGAAKAFEPKKEEPKKKEGTPPEKK
jgi:hypothetical protein